MNGLRRISCCCAVCGNVSDQVIAIVNCGYGPDDLDTRPAEPKRSVQKYEIQECPCCGYTSRSIELSPPAFVDHIWLQDANARLYCGLSFKDDTARSFFRYYMICKEAGNKKEALWAIMRAAWMCDDANDLKSAERCRTIGARIAEELLKETNDSDYQLLRVDFLRRAGLFQNGIEEIDKYVSKATRKKQICEFEKALMQKRDRTSRLVTEGIKYKGNMGDVVERI